MVNKWQSQDLQTYEKCGCVSASAWCLSRPHQSSCLLLQSLLCSCSTCWWQAHFPIPPVVSTACCCHGVSPTLQVPQLCLLWPPPCWCCMAAAESGKLESSSLSIFFRPRNHKIYFFHSDWKWVFTPVYYIQAVSTKQPFYLTYLSEAEFKNVDRMLR